MYGTDKGTEGPSLFYGAHNYTSIYEAYMDVDRGKIVNILEIGIGVRGSRWKTYIAHGKNKTGGASIKMWFDYFKKARVFAIDINSAKFLDNDRVVTFVADQGDIDDLKNVLEKVKDIEFDYIVDDGSHRPDHQQLTFSLFFPKLKPGGVYFIEDLENNGLGDKERGRNNGRHRSESVYNTRRVFKSMASNSKFISPNALLNQEFLLKNIESVIFYAPIYRIVPQVFFGKIFGKKGMLLQFKPGTERLCAIRKRKNTDDK